MVSFKDFLKKLYDKRDSLAKKEAGRDIERAMKERNRY